MLLHSYLDPKSELVVISPNMFYMLLNSTKCSTMILLTETVNET